MDVLAVDTQDYGKDHRVVAALQWARREHARILGGGMPAWRWCDAASPGSASAPEDAARVIVDGIPNGMTPADVQAVLEQAGPVLRVSLGRSNGTSSAVADMASADGAAAAASALGSLAIGRVVVRVRRLPGPPAPVPVPAMRLYIANIDPRLGADDLVSVLLPWGKLLAVRMSPADAHATRQAYVDVAYADVATRILDAVRAAPLAVGGRRLVVSRPSCGGPLPAETLPNTRNLSDTHSLKDSDTAAASGDTFKEEGISVRVELLSVIAAGMGDDERKDVLEDVREEASAICERPVTVSAVNEAVILDVPSERLAMKLISTMHNRWFDGRRVSAALLH